MKYVVAIPKSVLLVVTILTLALFTSIYPIIQWKPVFAGPDTAEDYVDIQSDVDSVIDKGTHSNFTAQMYGPDLINDTLTEANTGGGATIQNYVDQTSDVDSSSDLGTHDVFADLQASDSTYDLLSEATVPAIPVVENWNWTAVTGTQTSIAVDAPSGITVGELLVIIVSVDPTSASTWNAVTGWTLDGQAGGTSADQYIALYWKIAEVGDIDQSVTVTCTTGGDILGWYIRISGVDSGDVVEDSLYGTSSSSQTTHTISEVTTVESNTLVLYALSFDGQDGAPLTTAENPFYQFDNQDAGSGFGAITGCWGARNMSSTGGTTDVDVTANGASGADGASYFQIAFNSAGGSSDYQLDLEVQFTNVVDYLATEYLCIQTGTFSGSEDLNVTYWDGDSWEAIASDLTTSQWNNYTVSLTSSTFTIKFGGSTTTSDAVQDTWNIDAVLLQVSGAGSNEYIVDNEDSDVDGASDNGTLANFANMQDYPSNYATLTEESALGEIQVTQTVVEDFNSPTGTTHDITLSDANVGDLWLIVIAANPDGTGTVPNINLPSGWNWAGTQTDHGAASNGMLGIIYRVKQSGDPSVLTTTYTQTCMIAAICITYEGVDQSNPLDVAVPAYDVTENPPTSPDITTVTDGAWIVRATLVDGAPGFSDSDIPSGTTLRGTMVNNPPSNGQNLGVADEIQEFYGNAGSADWGSGARSEEAVSASVALRPATGSDDYVLNQEVQFVGLTPDLPIETLCIATGTTDAEDILVDVWDGDSWENVFSDLTASTWNNVSITSYLTTSTLTIQFRDGTPTDDITTQDSWQINIAIIYVENGVDNYELDLEEQFANADYSQTYEELCVYMGAFNAGGETLAVQWWNSTDSSWLTIISSLSTSQWNNVSVTDYLTSATFTIRFIDGTKTSDSSQGTWQKDACLLHTWTLGYNLNLRVMDLDLTDNIQGAYVYKDSDVKTSDAEGWANWTLVSGTVEIKVQYFGFWVNGTFSVTMDSDKTINVQCKLYDITVLVQESVQNAYLASANVTVYNSTSVQDNKITSGVTGNNGQVQLLNLPNNTLTFTQYGGASYSLVIGNTTQLVSSENQTITLTANQNSINTNNSYSIIAFAG